jgi:hypothetical protein
MRLDAQRDRETAKRKGSAVKTILGFIWLSLCFTAAYYLISWLFETGEVNPSFFWNQLFIPRQINLAGLKMLISVVIVVIMNFFVLLGYGFSSRTGRIRPGTPSLKSRNPDPNDKSYH